jgi:hypothetical protein
VALSLGVKRPRREADHSPPSSAEVKERVDLYIHSSNTPSWRGTQLKHRDNFTFTIIIIIIIIIIIVVVVVVVVVVVESRDSSVGTATRLRAGRSGFDSRRRMGFLLFDTVSRPPLGLTHPPIQWVPGALSLGVNRPGRDADHSPPSRAEVK